MDELDFLKDHWQRKERFPQIKAQEIRSMLHRSSSSIVQWIFVISILEFCAGWAIALLTPSIEYRSVAERFFVLVAEGIFYLVIVYFIYQFFRSFRAIKNTKDIKSLLGSIIDTRHHVERYIRFNIYYFCFSLVGAGVFALYARIQSRGGLEVGEWMLYVGLFIVAVGLVGLFFIWLVRLYYRLLYGILLKRLNKNYEELKSLEREVD